MSNRKHTYTIFGLLLSLLLVGGALFFVGDSKFALVPNAKGIYPSKLTLALQKVGIIKAEAILAPKACPINCLYNERVGSCECDQIDGGGCAPMFVSCGTDPYSCESGAFYNNPDSATDFIWSCSDGCGGPMELCSTPKTQNAVCGATHYNCSVGTEYPAYRYSGPDGWGWRCLGSGGGSNVDCHEGGPTINSLTLTNPIDYWGYTYLSYSSTGANSCTLRLDGGTWSAGGTSNSNVMYGHNIADNSFTLTCTAPNGINSYQTVRLNTRPRVSISADSTSKTYGQNATIVWSMTHQNSATCSVTKNGAAWQSTTNDSPSSPSSPDQATVKSASDTIYGNTTYTVTCTTQYGSTNSASVTVNLAATNGSCGGGNFTCNMGSSVNNVTNTYSYDWQCTGIAGGSTVNCSNPRPVAGACGGSINSCNAGTFVDAADDSNWNVWNCNGVNGGSNAGCSYQKTNGSCGGSINSCSSGTFQDTADSGTSNNWNCLGYNNGSNTSCGYPKTNGSCGGSINSCNSGSLSDTADDASYNRWDCVGSNNGTTVNCAIAKTNGSCGGSKDSCNSGTYLDTGDDDAGYNWMCNGVYGGSNASCSFPKPPVVSVSMQTANGGTSGRAYVWEAATLKWSATNNPSSCVIYKNGTAITTVAGSATSYTTEALPEGNTVYRVDCSNAGGSSSGNSVTFIVPTSPSGFSASCPQPGTSANFSWTLPSGYTGSYFRYCNGTSCDYTKACNPALTPPNGSCVNGTYSSISQATNPNGTYSWYVHTMDGYGNWSNGVGGSNIYCTPAAPNTPSISNPTPTTLGVGMNGNFTISGTDSVGMNVRYLIDSDNNGTVDITTSYGASGWGYTWTNNWGGAGSKTFQVKTEATDGRQSGWASKSVTIITPPSATLDISSASYGSNNLTDYGGSVTVGWRGFNSTTCSVTKNGAAWQSGITGSVDSGALPADTTFAITCSNAAGQTYSDSVVVRILPDISLSVNPPTSSLKCGDNPTISWTSNYTSDCTVKRAGTTIGTGATNAGVKFGVPISDYYFSVDWACTSATGYPHSGSFGGGNFKTDGACGSTNNTCNAGTVSDKADNGSQYLWDCLGGCTGSNVSCSANKPPLVPTISGPADGGVGANYNFVISGADPVGMQVKYAIDWDNDGIADGTTALGASGWNYTWTNNWGGPGTKYFKAKTISSDGRESGWTTYAGINIHGVPTVSITTPTPAVLYNAETSPISWSSTDASSCSVTKGGAAWQTGLSGAAVSSGNLVSDTAFVLTCSNIAGSNSATVNVYVKPTVSIGLSPTTIAYNGTSNISWSTNYAGSCSVTKAGAAWQTGVSSAGVSSGALTTNTLFKIDCSSVTGKATNSTQATVTVNPLNGACNATHYTCNAGSSVNNVSGAMKWTWNCNGANGGTNAACEQVKPAPNVPTITGPTDGKINTNYNFTISATNPSGDPIRYAIDWDNNGTVDGYLPVSGTTTSGTSLVWTNQWAGSGTKTFKVRTETNGGPVSGWTTHNIALYGLPDVTWTPSNGNMAYGDRLTLGYAATDASYCNIFSTVAGNPNAYEAAPFWDHAPTTYTWTNVGPYYNSFKRKAVCYNPFGEYKSVEFVGTVTQNDAVCTDMAISNYLVPNEKFSPTIVLTNTGSNIWNSIAPNLHNVFIGQNIWGVNRYLPLTNAPVNPGAQGSFKGAADVLTAPSTEGLYDFSVRGVQAIESGETFYGATCTPVTVHPGNKILVKAPTLGIGDSDVDITDLAFPMSYVVNDPAVVKTVTIRNRGGGTINGSISIPASKFTCVSGCSFILGPGGTSTATLSFASNATGTFSTPMNVNSDAGNKVVNLNAGTGAKFTIKSSPLDFGDVAIGKYRYLTLSITNNSLSQPSGAFGITPTAPIECKSACGSADLAPNSTREVRLKFTPTSTSTITQNLVLTTNPSVTITIKARGIKPVFKVEEK